MLDATAASDAKGGDAGKTRLTLQKPGKETSRQKPNAFHSRYSAALYWIFSESAGEEHSQWTQDYFGS